MVCTLDISHNPIPAEENASQQTLYLTYCKQSGIVYQGKLAEEFCKIAQNKTSFTTANMAHLDVAATI
jgi:hypothetical protein